MRMYAGALDSFTQAALKYAQHPWDQSFETPVSCPRPPPGLREHSDQRAAPPRLLSLGASGSMTSNGRWTARLETPLGIAQR